MSTYEKPIEWMANPRARTIANSSAVASVFPAGVFEQARSFHRQIPGYRPSPLRNLSSLASKLSVGGIWV
ncbi:MAG: diaminopropionate ammonia-lyase, partial [Acidimicrobiia bacterium]|nr:diaminopropionate ammonia-lyase [Acidimicrobiia bacterium]MDX2466999.1 diaminopropionate ammonia-lyase [Acidimicrobiia bacterium]